MYKKHHNKDTNSLLAFIYKNYPFYSINSEIIDKYLSNDEIYAVKNPIESKKIQFYLLLDMKV